LFRIVEGIVEASYRPAGISECGMGGDIGNALAIDVNGAVVAETVDVGCAVQELCHGRNGVLIVKAAAVVSSSPSSCCSCR